MLLYCPVCGKHTEHVEHAALYATRCTICNTQTSKLERLINSQQHLTAPDGTPATVEQNTPNRVVFRIATGKHKGYYEYDKRTGKRTKR